MSNEVRLYQYDLSGGMAAQFSQLLIGRHLQGIWHTAIVICGSEYYFDGGVGIVKNEAGQTRFGTPVITKVIGMTSKTQREFEEWNRQQISSSKYGPTSYNLLSCNCNHYTQDASQFLLSKDIPSDVRDMIPMVLSTPLGAMIKPMLEKMSLDPGRYAAQMGFPSFGQFGTEVATTTSFTSVGMSDGERFSEGSLVPMPLPPAIKEDLMVHLTLIHTCEDHTKEEIIDCLDALHRIVSNMVMYPNNNKYQRISLSSDFYITKLGTFSSSKEILTAIGFKPDGTADTPHMHFQGEFAYLNSVLEHISDVKDAIVNEV